MSTLLPTSEKDQHWQDWMTLLGGAFLFFSPFLLEYGSREVSLNSYIVGGALMASTIAALFMPAIWEEVIVMLLGLWLLAAPWILEFSDLHYATSIAIGIAVIALVSSSWAIQDERRFAS